MPDFTKILDALERLLKFIFPQGTPPQLLKWIGIAMAVAFLLMAVWGLLYVLSKIKKLWVEEFWPFFYDRELKKRQTRRQRFADHILIDLRKLNSQEAWSDFRFAELEAEVEAEGRRDSFFHVPLLAKGRSGVRRERSLSAALKTSRERLILIEGDPGSGKSVALRHVAVALAGKAMHARSINSVIPLYINLKGLNRGRKESIDRNLIHRYVLDSINRANDSDIARFLDEEFEDGIQRGTWLFLFDSFDEIQEILSSTEADAVIKSYTEAVSDFLQGFNQCRGILASRHYHGPRQFGWPRFRILPLTPERRLELLRRADLPTEVESELIGNLELSKSEIYSMSNNPMFLSLLCEHMRSGRPFPNSTYSVFESYIGTRLSRDEERLKARFGVEIAEVRAAAESVAFCMSADMGLGLAAPRRSISEAIRRHSLPVLRRLDALLDALEYVKLARSDNAEAPSDSRAFTFAHRRFQEYFATSVVLRHEDKVNSKLLLCDARWRETAVVICQTRGDVALSRLMTEAGGIIEGMMREIQGRGIQLKPLDEQKPAVDDAESPARDFYWPPGCLHILSLLQDGFTGRVHEVPDGLRLTVGRIVVTAAAQGTHLDRKRALEVAGIIPEANLISLLRKSFESSQWLRDTAYWQASRLSEMPADIAKGIRAMFVRMALHGEFWKHRLSVKTYINRLSNQTLFAPSFRLISLSWLVDLFIYCFLALWLVAYARVTYPDKLNFVGVFALIAVSLYLSWASLWKSMRMASGNVAPDLMLGMAGFLRFVVPLFVLVNIFNFKLNWRDTSYAFLFVVFSTWAPFALYYAAEGKFSHPFFWPFLSLIAIVNGIFEVVSGFIRPRFYRVIGRAMAFLYRGIVERLSWRTAVWAAVGSLVLIAATYFYPLVVAGLFVISIYLYLIAALLAALARFVNSLARDAAAWRRWCHPPPPSVTASELVERLFTLNLKRSRMKYLHMVRTREMLEPTAESERLISFLALMTENGEFDEAALAANVPNLAPGHEDSRGAAGLEARFTKMKNADTVDELYRLVEQLQHRRAA